MLKKAVNLNALLAVLLVVVTAFLLSAVPVKAKSALGLLDFKNHNVLENGVSKVLIALEKVQNSRYRVLGISDVPENNLTGQTAKESTSNVNNTINQSDTGVLNGSPLPPPRTASEWRNSPGKAFSSGGLSYVKDGDKWLRGTQSNAGKVPKQIADKLSGQQFKNFDEFRQTFWVEVAKDPVLSKKFNPQNRQRMLNGSAPFAPTTQQVGGRKVYELDHNHEIQNGGSVYDVNNIIIRTPLNHIKGK